jgi:hypothetical protein
MVDLSTKTANGRKKISAKSDWIWEKQWRTHRYIVDDWFCVWSFQEEV